MSGPIIVGNPVNGQIILGYVPMPPKPGFAEVAFTLSDTVAAVTSPFTMQTQMQSWPGADWWSGTATLPAMTDDTADAWISWLAELRGMEGCFLLGDPKRQKPRGHVQGVPVVDGTVAANNKAMTRTLYTKGWKASQFGLLLPRDYFQLNNRLHMVLDRVNSDASGNAAIAIWPSIREQPGDGNALKLQAPMGLMRLTKNQRGWHVSPRSATAITFEFTEKR